MKQSNDFAHDMIDLDIFPQRILYIAARDVKASVKNGEIKIRIPFQPMRHNGTFHPLDEAEKPRKEIVFYLSAYGDEILRFSGNPEEEIEAGEIEKAEKTGQQLKQPLDDSSVMLDPSMSLQKQDLSIHKEEEGLLLVQDKQKRVRARITVREHQQHYWSDLQRAADPMIQIEFFPDGNLERPVLPMSYDHFFPGKLESVPFGFAEDNGEISAALFSFHADADEHFFGTGERFNRLDLSGRTLTLENTDALGTASRKAYKNIPFFFSSAGYGIFAHSTAHMRMSFTDISNRAVQGIIEESRLDLFLIGGGTPQHIIRNYCSLTGFSPELPLWSYGMWMSRMTYFSAEEVESITARLRKEEYPCDVIHLDSGYFSEDWVCDWAFSPERFPNPEQFISRLKDRGFRISLWQTPNIGKENRLYDEAKQSGFLPDLNEEDHMNTMSDFSGQDFGGQIDFTCKPAVEWNKNLLRGLLDLGAACIKTDFGEKILMHADFKGMSPKMLHNIYSVLYQKAAFEVSSEYTEKPFIWGRSCWAGGQRYPLHWGGDTSASWDGMASTLRGGLQFGLSGYVYWSHDIPGFHGLPEFMNTPPTEELYLRWTQLGVFTSHMRYHGTTPREPWEFPRTASLVRKWLRFRYALIPYIIKEAAFSSQYGRPLMAALLYDFAEDDPAVWQIDDEYMFGRDVLAAPIMNARGLRNIYLPKGRWIELYSGKVYEGQQCLINCRYPLSQIPIFVRFGAEIPYYPKRTASTNEMDLSRSRRLSFDETYKGLQQSPLGAVCGFTEEDFSADRLN